MPFFRGEIQNEEGEYIFSRRGKFDDAQKCLEALCKRVHVDAPSVDSLLHNMTYGGGFSDSPYCLKRHYRSISGLKFSVQEIN